MITAIPQIHAIIISSVEKELTQFAIQESAKQITVGGMTWFFGKELDSLDSVARKIWYESWKDVKQSHLLFLQYDGWIVDGGKWQPSWLNYDYIGAPWPWHSTLRVGNGGFSLRSRRLMQHLSLHRERCPLQLGQPEDDILCRQYRAKLEVEGFRWAPDHIARDFAFEREAPRPTFGFHGLFNVPKILDPEALQLWMGKATSYARNKAEWKEIDP